MTPGLTGARLPRTGRALLGCGIAYPIVYVIANDVVAARRYDGYSRVDERHRAPSAQRSDRRGDRRPARRRIGRVREEVRVYSLASGAFVLATGAVTAKLGAGLTEGKPSPGMGLYERADMGAWMLWMAALAVALLREKPPPGSEQPR